MIHEKYVVTFPSYLIGPLSFPRYNINWNYGLLPQTWEDPTLANSEVEGAFGDNDPGKLPFSLLFCMTYMLCHSQIVKSKLIWLLP